MKTAKLFIALIAAGVISAPNAQAQVRITEWMYTGAPGEFIEFTNLGPAAIDLTGWSFDDNSRLPGSVNLTALGNVNPGESVVITEIDCHIKEQSLA